ncbi:MULTISPECIES: DUF4043 family protein [Sphingomonas]|uniref:phage capsid family protein n=1 Tax=Sphingomonas TaxID=13687 RepID=UPI00126A1BB4|nr:MULTISPECIES: DUF4043 family protein [Sphingomonas]
MANSTLSLTQQKQVWEANFTTDYYRQSGFLKFMGDGNDALIRVNKKLSKEKGALIHLPMVPKLTGAGINGSTILRGNEEKQRNWSFAIRTAYAGNSVAVHEADAYQSEIQLLDAGRPGLKDWSARRERNMFTDALQSVIIRGSYSDAAGNDQTVEDTTVLYGSATEAQKDLHLDNNADRTVFADTANSKSRALATTAPAGGATNDMSATLLTITAADKLSVAILGVAKRKAQMTEASVNKPSIMPLSTSAEDFQENYVLFCDLPGFRDLQADLKQANLDGRPRDPSKNPFFTDGCLFVNGITVVPIPTLGNLGGVGASGTVVGNAFLCGASALGKAVSMLPEARTDTYSYGQVNGVAIVMVDAAAKLAYNGAAAGVVGIYHASLAD